MILEDPDPRLRVVCPPSQARNPLVEKSLLAAIPEDALGLAAPQIGSAENLVLLPGGIFLYNLSWSAEGEREEAIEGCLSLPGEAFLVRRFQKISWQARNVSWDKISGQAEGLLARVLQHESDHLRGILISDIGERVEDETP